MESRLMVLNRDHTLFTTLGHVISFEADKATNVPGDVVHLALAIGAVDAADVAEPKKGKKAAE